MIYDHRTYTCKPGMVPAQLALYQKLGFAPQRRHLGDPVLYASAEIGKLNSFVHIWAYADLADRTAKRAAMGADPEWQAYLKASYDLGAIVLQENTILVDAPFMQRAGG